MSAEKKKPDWEVSQSGEQQAKATTSQRTHHTTSATPVEVVLARLENFRQAGPGRWRAPCPGHGGKDFNLAIRELPDGTVLLKDWSHGCTADDITAALGLELRDLFPGCCPSDPGRPGGGRGSGLSSRRRRELRERLDHERDVLRIIEADLESGTATRFDAERAGTAIEHIRNIKSLLGLGGAQ